MKTTLFNIELISASSNRKSNLKLALRIIPWIGLLLCLGIIIFSRTPPPIEADEQHPSAPDVPNLSLTLTDDPDPVKLGQEVTYTLTATNDGAADATEVVLTSLLDPNVTFKEASGDGSYDDGTRQVTWNIGQMPAGQTLKYTVTVTVTKIPKDKYLIANKAEITSKEGALDCDGVSTTVLYPKLSIAKSADPVPASPGKSLTYTLVISNIGYAEATGVQITDILDDSVTFQTASDEGTHSGETLNGTVTWPSIASLKPWQSVSRKIKVKVNEYLECGDFLINTAKVTAKEGVMDEVTIETPIGGGKITVMVCGDLDADGVCGPDLLSPLPSGIQARVTGGDEERPYADTPASFSVGTGTFNVGLRFTGESQGLYPTIPSKSVTTKFCEDTTVKLPVIDPIHPKGVAVHKKSNKVYVPFQGPEVSKDNFPYPFVAVIDSDTDQVLKTIPGEMAATPGIGRRPWSAVSSQNYVYVGSFESHWVSIIDPKTDTVVKNIDASAGVPSDFKPAVSAANPNDPNKVHFADYNGGVLVIDNLEASSYTDVSDPPGDSTTVYSPFEIVVADNAPLGRNFVTMRDAVNTNFQIRAFDTSSSAIQQYSLPVVGSPHTIGLWQNHPSGQPRLYVTYADDPPPSPIAQGYRNPDNLLIYRYDPSSEALTLIKDNKDFREYAEVGLIYNPAANNMLGAYSGFPYWNDPDYPNWEQCMDSFPSIRGGTYTIDKTDTVGTGPTPNRVVGNLPITAPDLGWKNPFELAFNPNNDKIYVTDRCWNEWAAHGGVSKPAHGAVLVIGDVKDTDPNDPGDKPGEFHFADVNKDGQVDLLDLTYIADRYGSNDPIADINKDGIVDVVDMSIVMSNFT